MFDIDPIQQGAIANAVTEATSGGAMLEYLEGKVMPGIAAVQG
jgi:3-phosphoglycerate kinase